MSKRGIALFFSLAVAIVLSILLGAFFFSSVTENNLARRYAHSARALWTAEAGIAEAIEHLPSSPNNGNLSGCSYQAVTTYRTAINATNYYDINSTGTVSLPSGGNIQRMVNAVVKSEAPTNTGKFNYVLQAANEICFSGNCNDSKADKYIIPLNCNGHLCWKDSDPTVNFSDMFGLSQSEVSAMANHYNETGFPSNVSGVTWVDVSPGGLLHRSGGGGTGILIINGNCKFTGGFTWHGIIWVIGLLDASLGNSNYYGATVVSHDASADDDVSGSAAFYYNTTDIQNAINNLPAKKQIVSWREAQ